MIDNILTADQVYDIQSKVFKIMEGYVSIALYAMSALPTFFLIGNKLVNKNNYGISTCFF